MSVKVPIAHPFVLEAIIHTIDGVSSDIVHVPLGDWLDASTKSVNVDAKRVGVRECVDLVVVDDGTASTADP